MLLVFQHFQYSLGRVTNEWHYLLSHPVTIIQAGIKGPRTKR